jgi:hypothetical protein
MSSIIPPRPKRASLPVIVKSVSTATVVASPSARSELTMVALAEPWPRLSWPLARMTARWASASTSSIDSSPR